MNCKPNQLARIVKKFVAIDNLTGETVYSDHRDKIVKCVSLYNEVEWKIEQPIIARFNFLNLVVDYQFISIHDDWLRPIENPGDDVEDESKAWLPPVPTLEKV